MAFYTKEYLRNRLDGTSSEEIQQLINSFRAKNSYDVFLSHSYSDKEFIQSLILELESINLDVYVDWIVDPELKRSSITKHSIQIIRERLRQSKCLIYATSVASSRSRWMPWELGYMDGLVGKCAILPILERKNAIYQGKDLLQVYPYITLDETRDQVDMKRIRIHESTHDYTRIDSWLNK
ncbi:MAG: TIR domain-containing protein [Cytophagales bacterium]|nr:TIR domain-containing protein [Cytophagales bacterium]